MSRTDKRQPGVRKEDILNATRDGLDIYNKYTRLSVKGDRYVGLCPFHSEKTGSFQVFGKRNSYKCFGCGEGGADAIAFLMAKENISFIEAIKKASSEFSVSPSAVAQPLAPIVKEELVIDWVDQPFTSKHKYWNKYLLPENYLRNKNVFAVEKWAINGRAQFMGKEEQVYAYWAEDIDKVKILRVGPNIEKEQKWKNTVPNSYIWNMPKQSVEELWVMKAYKDSLCMDYHFGKTTCALQNEDPTIFLEHGYYKVDTLADKKVICMGSDDQGWHSSYLITHLTGWEYFNSPNYLLRDGVQDIADVIGEYGLDIVEKDLIKKGYL